MAWLHEIKIKKEPFVTDKANTQDKQAYSECPLLKVWSGLDGKVLWNTTRHKQ